MTATPPPQKRSLQGIIKPFTHFMQHESTAGVLLFVSALLGLLWANSPFAASYDSLWHQELSIGIASFSISHSIHYWINDGLMAMFFFVVGLEIKREVIAGELSSPKNAALPLLAALGGMVVPALIYLAFNPSGPGHAGWGIPMATDIAFALGILSLLGPRVPLSLKVFLTALAIADDLGAVLVIAFFYTSQISFFHLGIGATALSILLAGNYLGVRNVLFYGIIGIGGVWLAFLLSGVHATIAGILAAFMIPARTKINERDLADSLTGALAEFKQLVPNQGPLLDAKQLHIIDQMKDLLHAGDTPLQRLEHNLHPLVAFAVLPLFALANAGISLNFAELDGLFHPVTVGVALGLLVGKFVGITGACFIAVKAGWTKLPSDLSWAALCGAALLAGIGFTMSLFITNLAFTDPSLALRAKLGILPASLLAGAIGFIVLSKVLPPAPSTGKA